MLSERLEEWAHGYKAEGVQQGEALALQKQLTKRFGAMPAGVLEKIAVASPEQIDEWLSRCLMPGVWKTCLAQPHTESIFTVRKKSRLQAGIVISEYMI